MAARKYLAFDFGAESGRAMLGLVDERSIQLAELHRFANRQVTRDGHLHWDLAYLRGELERGLAAAAAAGHKELAGIGVDTWGVDFGLLDADDRLLSDPYAYRDSRTAGVMEEVFATIPREELYRLTGSQFMQFNSLFQLVCTARREPEVLARARTLLFMPDLFNFFMTGEKSCEYTIASTSQMLNARTRTWEEALFSRLGLPRQLVLPLTAPGTRLAPLSEQVAARVGLPRVQVIAPACHDTASAVAAVPAGQGSWAYLSSGTWSLLGVELQEPMISELSLQGNFTNEGGVGGTIRFLRNTMGLWLLQRCRRDWERSGRSMSYDELVALAKDAQPFATLVDPDDASFLNPPDMPAAIRDFALKTGQQPPQSKGGFVRCVLESLALKYRFLVERLRFITGVQPEVLHIVGGGSQNELLNQFTADATGLPVLAGPVEATALGNIAVQAIATGQLASLAEARELIARSFPLKEYRPQHRAAWDEAYGRAAPLFH
ncbi:MAG: rhamnulokinase family protein [bacterium]|jgi:rhamnulokinase|nr:rhamnulokinase [candidate division KSB1 bacterium]MDH7560423.1 rhamnulokinase family protein [bacterium]